MFLSFCYPRCIVDLICTINGGVAFVQMLNRTTSDSVESFRLIFSNYSVLYVICNRTCVLITVDQGGDRGRSVWRPHQ